MQLGQGAIVVYLLVCAVQQNRGHAISKMTTLVGHFNDIASQLFFIGPILGHFVLRVGAGQVCGKRGTQMRQAHTTHHRCICGDAEDSGVSLQVAAGSISGTFCDRLRRS